MQWTYIAGNNWGYCNGGEGALGCGNQEHFRACSDIQITDSDKDLQVPNSSVKVNTIFFKYGFKKLTFTSNNHVSVQGM